MLTDQRAGRSRLLWKLLAINVPILVLVLVFVWLSIDTLAAGYFGELMERYHINPADTHQMFLEAVHRYLAWAVAGGLVLAVLLSFLLTRRVLQPLSEIAHMTSRVAAGNYDARVQVRGRDELAELANAFNGMADSLERVERLRKRLVSDIAHELRTPLTNVRGYLEALQDGVLPAEADTFEVLQTELRRLTKLADDLLELTRADAARAYLKPQVIDLRDTVSSVLDMNAHRFEAKGIRVATRFACDPQYVSADPEKILQAIGNLVENAWRYTPDDGTFCIETERVEGAIRTSFSNDSQHIPDQDLELIFERFYRPDESRSREHGGAGIGLAVVKDLIEAHGGSVGASQAQGRIRIWFTLPA